MKTTCGIKRNHSIFLFLLMLQDINVENIDHYLVFHLVKESHREAVLTIPTTEFINSKADYLQLYCKSSYKRVSKINQKADTQTLG